MGYPCAISGCRTNRPGGQKRRTFSIPRDSERKKIWERAIGISLSDGKRRFVCEKHFASDHILRYNEYTDSFGNVITRIPLRVARLSKDAIPYLFPPETVDDKENYRILEGQETPVNLEEEIIIERNLNDENETTDTEKQNENYENYLNEVLTDEQNSLRAKNEASNIECEIITDFQETQNINNRVNSRGIPRGTVIEQTRDNCFIIKIPYEEEVVRNETCDSGLEMHLNDDKIHQVDIPAENISQVEDTCVRDEQTENATGDCECDSGTDTKIDESNLQNQENSYADTVETKYNEGDLDYQENLCTENADTKDGGDDMYSEENPCVDDTGATVDESDLYYHENNCSDNTNTKEVEGDLYYQENLHTNADTKYDEGDLYYQEMVCTDNVETKEEHIEGDLLYQENHCTDYVDTKDDEGQCYEENGSAETTEQPQSHLVYDNESNGNDLIASISDSTPQIDNSQTVVCEKDRSRKEPAAFISKKRKFENFETIFLKVEGYGFGEFSENIESYKMPGDWLVHTPPDGTCIIIFEIYENSGTAYEAAEFGSYDVRRSILIKDTMKVFYSALGRSINPKDFNLPTKFHSFEEFEATLDRFSNFNVCYGLKNSAKINQFNDGNTYTDCVGTLRHKNCSILTSHQKCISCEKITIRARRKSDGTASKNNNHRNEIRTKCSIYYDRDIMNILKRAT